VSRSGDLAYVQGVSTETHTDPKTKKEVTEKGKWVTIYKKQAGGDWKAAVEMYNVDAPPSPAK
jgi:ketosteroid isomerase-like protein